MTDDEQLAESVKYSSELVWHFAEIRPGVYVLYDYERRPVIITTEWNKILDWYSNRPVYIPKPKVKLEPNISGIDLSKLEFTL